jgi:hypothetical protein
MSTSTNANTMESCLEFASKIVSNKKDQKEYAEALLECRQHPAYHVLLKSGDIIPISSYPLMHWDNKGWNTVKRKIRVKKVKTAEELDEEADLDNWEDVEHYGRVTYTNTAPAYEHNGALFDIGARF